MQEDNLSTSLIYFVFTKIYHMSILFLPFSVHPACLSNILSSTHRSPASGGKSVAENNGPLFCDCQSLLVISFICPATYSTHPRSLQTASVIKFCNLLEHSPLALPRVFTLEPDLVSVLGFHIPPVEESDSFAFFPKPMRNLCTEMMCYTLITPLVLSSFL